MNWKSTAAASGLTLVATWLGLSPSIQVPAARPAAAPRDSRPAVSDIQAQADRLQVRVRKEMDYRDPSRNPFRFSHRPSAPRPTPAVVEAPVVLAAPTIQPLPFTLSGMATDGPDAVRTAILTTPSDVVFAKEGDRVAGFTLTRVDEAGIEVMAADGSVRRLTLTP
jgi:hypothetical protein